MDSDQYGQICSSTHFVILNSYILVLYSLNKNVTDKTVMYFKILTWPYVLIKPMFLYNIPSQCRDLFGWLGYI